MIVYEMSPAQPNDDLQVNVDTDSGERLMFE